MVLFIPIFVCADTINIDLMTNFIYFYENSAFESMVTEQIRKPEICTRNLNVQSLEEYIKAVRKILIYHLNTQFPSLIRRKTSPGLTIYNNFTSRIRNINTTQRFDQSTFTTPIRTSKTMNLTFI